jgi:hypothetical protein
MPDGIHWWDDLSDLASHVGTEGGMMKRADHSWLGRLDAAALWSEACAEEHSANEHKSNHE